jgi:hypothetical protein
MREELRRRRRAAKRGMQGSGETRSGEDGPVDPLELLESPEPEAEAAFERAWAASILREACEEVETICHADGEDSMWLLFRRHFLDGQPYALLVDETGYEPARAAVVARTVANRVRATLKRLIVRDGIPEDEVESELASIVALMSRVENE